VTIDTGVPELTLEEEIEGTFGRIIAEPLEAGFGTTVGNALRRTLLSALPGTAITAVRIEGVEHEFSTLPNVKEDMVELLLNLKDVRIRSLTERSGKMYLDVNGEREVTAGDIQPSADYEIVNPELHIATLESAAAHLSIEFTIDQGRGYQPAGSADGLPIGVIPVDAIFSPVSTIASSTRASARSPTMTV
jgi:DNA-directed RNA polymerase subunit alpha